jgi:hypothetical protein
MPPPEPAARPAFALGVAEANPHLIAPSGDPAFAVARDRLVALRPQYARLMVDWSKLQPDPGRPPDFSAPRDGCMRGLPPCGGSAGVRALLEAIRDRQRLDGGWQVVVAPYGTPPWAAQRVAGCAAGGRGETKGIPDPEAYRRLIRALQRLGDDVGVALPYWSPWNEPNHPTFLHPQRRGCSPGARPVSPTRYGRLARVVAAELRAGQSLVLGDVAGYPAPQSVALGAAEFAGALPRDVACLDGPWAVHTYVGERARGGAAPAPAPTEGAANRRLIDAVDRVLRGQGCPKPIWVTETGAFDHRCAAMAHALATWARDPRVDAAFQYTFREDPEFPEGLAAAGLGSFHPSYKAWLAFARLTGPEPPRRPCA